jgi:hypothetical protein
VILKCICFRADNPVHGPATFTSIVASSNQEIHKIEKQANLQKRKKEESGAMAEFWNGKRRAKENLKVTESFRIARGANIEFV